MLPDPELIARRQGVGCLICGERWTDRAHIWPSGIGGQTSTYRAGNIIGLCHPCHMIFDGHQLAGRQHMLRLLMEARRDLVELQRGTLKCSSS